ncbi:MAG: PadR family transcriptional regulator [Mycobacteriales bacterium]
MTPEPDRQAQLLRGALDMCLLTLLSEQPTHAYDLVVRFEERGLSGVGYGTIYPLVGRMRRLGLLDESAQPSPSGPARKVFSVSQAGQAALSSWVQQWLSTTSAVSGLLTAAGVVPDQLKERA